MAKSKKVQPEKTSKAKKFIPEPRILLMRSGKIATDELRFEVLAVGTPFVHGHDTFLKVGASSAICLQSIAAPDNWLPAVVGTKQTFRKAAKVAVANVDITIYMSGRHLAKLPQRNEEPAENANSVSDITENVIGRAG